MIIKKITIIIGSPGSGKSTLGNHMQNQGNGEILFLDDISINIKKNPIEYIKYQAKLSQANHIVIADVNFCFTHIRENAFLLLENAFNLKIDTIYFENNLDKCLNNIEYRKKIGDIRKVTELAKTISKVYSIPNNISPINIFSTTSTKFKF